METMEELKTKIKFSRKNTLPLLVLFFLCWHPGFIGSESLTLTTYYPAPYGGYVSLLTTQNTILTRDGGNLSVGNGAATSKLHVFGNSNITGNAIVAGSSSQGQTYLTNSDMYFNNTGHSHTSIGNAWGNAAIENASNFNTLMILGRSGGLGGVRSVSIWDRLDVNGDLYVTGNIMNVCSRVGYSVGGTVNCPAGKSVVGFMGDGVARVTGFLPGGSTTSNWGTFIVLGEDWGGTMVCCKF